MMTPSGRTMPSAEATSADTVSPVAPNHGLTSRAPEPTPAMTVRTMFDGTAKPMPIDPPPSREKIAVLMPTRRPSMPTSAPPELPGLMAASVWMKKRKSAMPTVVRATAETIPLVTVCPTPNGLPIASTRSPTSRSSESRSSSDGSRSAPGSMRSTARSVRSSARSTVASNSRRSASTTVISSAPRMTWLFVTMMPFSSTMTPEPSAFCCRSAPGSWSPKKRRKNGSLSSGDGDARTIRRVLTLTTAGAARFTSGA